MDTLPKKKKNPYTTYMAQMTSRIATAQVIAILELVIFDPRGQDRHTSCPRAREQGRRSVKGLIQPSRSFVIHGAAL